VTAPADTTDTTVEESTPTTTTFVIDGPGTVDTTVPTPLGDDCLSNYEEGPQAGIVIPEGEWVEVFFPLDAQAWGTSRYSYTQCGPEATTEPREYGNYPPGTWVPEAPFEPPTGHTEAPPVKSLPETGVGPTEGWILALATLAVVVGQVARRVARR